jgi:PAS domain-containing protein
MIGQLSQEKIQAAVGILVVDNQRRIVSLNRNFIEMWRLPKHLIVSQNEDQALEFVSSQFEEPKSFLKDVREVNRRLDLEIHDTIKFKDGRVLERYSQPLWLEEKYMGRVWMCRELAEFRWLNDLTLIDQRLLRFPNPYKVKRIVEKY